MGEDQKGGNMSKIAGELNAEMMHPKVIHEQRKALFAEMVGKTGSTQSVLDRLIQEIAELRQQRDDLAALGSNYLSRANAAEQECSELREQVTLLRDALESAINGMGGSYALWEPTAREAMKATEPKL